jgi:hypothetical protein
VSALFAFKLALVPFFILALSLAGRRWGTAVSGWLVALPVVAGPIVFFIGMEQGEAFAAGAADLLCNGGSLWVLRRIRAARAP